MPRRAVVPFHGDGGVDPHQRSYHTMCLRLVTFTAKNCA